MSDFAKMDIFFMVATVATVLIALLAGFALFYMVRILRNVEHISDIASEEVDLVRKDVHELRTHVRKEGFGIRPLARFFGRLFQRIFTRRR